MGDNKEATAKELAIRKKIYEANKKASEKFAAYRRGWQDGACIRSVCDIMTWQDDYNNGYADGRKALREWMESARKVYGLKPEGIVRAV